MNKVSGGVMPTISVVLPVYNGEQYLAEALDSILAQTFADFELIVIDDGSTDGSLSLLQEYEKRDARIRLVARENRNLATTLNDSIALAKGEWIARMDHDDIALPHRFERQLEWLEQTSADICGSWIRTFGDTLPRVRRGYTGSEALRLQLLFNSCFAHPTVIARRRILEKYPYDSSSIHAEDYDLWTRLAAAGIPFTNFPGVTLHYRVHNQQTTITKQFQQDAARARIARAYRLACFPEFGAQGEHDDIMSRLTLLPQENLVRVVDAFANLCARIGDPEGVISDNAFLFLARHAEFGKGGMRAAMSRLSFSYNQQLVLMALATLRANQQTFLYKWFYRLK